MAAMKFLEEFTAGGGLAYNAYQSAQPQTLAYALQDSPAGWLAWVMQLFQRWGDPTTSSPTPPSTGSPARSDRRSGATTPTPPRRRRAHRPNRHPHRCGDLAEDFQSVRKLADRDHANIISWNHYDRGSHFSPHDAATCCSPTSATSSDRCDDTGAAGAKRSRSRPPRRNCLGRGGAIRYAITRPGPASHRCRGDGRCGRGRVPSVPGPARRAGVRREVRVRRGGHRPQRRARAGGQRLVRRRLDG